MSEDSLDRERTEALAGQILLPIRANYQRGPFNRDRVYEALNALAFCTAVVVQGAGSHEALEWFSSALNQALKENFKTRE